MLNYLKLREVIAETLFVFDIAMCVILIHYIWRCISHSKEWWKLANVQGATALLVLFIGHTIIRGWSVASFVYVRRGGSIMHLENNYPIALLGTAISVVGLCWMIRVFSPLKWQERGWIIACCVAAAFVAFMRWAV